MSIAQPSATSGPRALPGFPLSGPVAVVGAAATIAAAAAFLWLLFAVPVSAVARYLAYEAAFTALPGVLAFMAFTGARRIGLRELGLGWGLGYALELIAFVVTAAAGARGLFWAYPPIVVVVALTALAHRRRRVPRDEAGTGRPVGSWVWGMAALVVVLLVYLADGYFASDPLPGEVNGPLAYYQDYVWQISLAAEALHHWPLQLPNVAGTALHYHFFAYAHMAAISQVTGLDLAMVNLRLYAVPLVVLATLQLVLLGRALGAGSWGGVGAAALVFLVGPFDPWPRPPSELFTHIYQSASYGYSLVFFLPLALLLVEQLDARGSLGDRRRWALVAVFAAAASGAKGSILPVVLVALAVLGAGALWAERRRPWRERRLTGRVAIAGATVAAAALAAKLTVYRGAGGDLHFQPFRAVARMYPAALIHQAWREEPILKPLLVGVTVVLDTLKLLAPLLVGLWVAVRAGGRRLAPRAAWVLVLLAVSLAAYYAYYHPATAQVWLLYYGYVAAGALSAVGLRLLWRRHLAGVRWRPGWVAAAALLALLVWATDGPPGSRLGEPTPPAIYRYVDGQVTWSDVNANLTPELRRGFRWIERHTPTDAVLAVNNRWQDAGGVDPRYCYYTAFAERRVMLECEYGTNRLDQFASLPQLLSDPGAGAFGDRARINQGIFHAGDPAAVAQAMRRFRVSYLVLDLVHPFGAKAQTIQRFGPVVFRNRALVVVSLRSP